MTWITFTIYLLIGYVVYYTLNILFDLLKKPTTTAGEVETLTVSDEVETIEVYDDDDDYPVVSENNSGKENEQSNANNLKKEVTPSQEETQDQIIPSTVEVEISQNGGISLKSLAQQYREEAILESKKLPFAS